MPTLVVSMRIRRKHCNMPTLFVGMAPRIFTLRSKNYLLVFGPIVIP
jgi:hypothetical protein